MMSSIHGIQNLIADKTGNACYENNEPYSHAKTLITKLLFFEKY